MKAIIQPMVWGLAMASMLALASSVALDLAVGSLQPVSGENRTLTP
ncbi:hypothetical protein [Stutzerimonas stutzeri]|jgi:hypothetical protein|nr:hypothetical protein [Stutzerimonas stutzeri]EQM76016.1 hypothetical protein L686_18830 [Stutzerimonas stutzeri MF28]